MSVRILIVHPHRSFTDGLAGLLSAEADLEVLEAVQTSSAALEAIERLRPDVVLLDLDLVKEALVLIQGTREQDQKVRFVTLSARPQLRSAIDAVRAGASAYLSADSPVRRLVNAVRGVAGGESHIPPELLTGVLEALQGNLSMEDDVRTRLDRLSGRELEVLGLMVDGLSKPQIGERLYISGNTVRTHIKNILGKLEVHSSLQAVSLALRGGMRPQAGGRDGDASRVAGR